MATTSSSKRQLIHTSNTYQSNSDLTVGGDLFVNGATTTIDTANLLVEDKNIVIGNVSSPSDTTADGGGFTLKGASDYTINWTNSTNSWHFNQGITVGVDDTGYDVKFFGATAGRYLLWDESANALTGVYDLKIADSRELQIGGGNDLRLYHSHPHSYIVQGNSGGSLYIRSHNTIQLENSSGQDMLTAASGGAVKLFHGGDSTAKLETTGSGVSVTGSARIDGSSGDGVLTIANSAGSQSLRFDQNSIRTTTNNNLTFLTNGNLNVALRIGSAHSANLTTSLGLK
jgi:hypothetical protein